MIELMLQAERALMVGMVEQAERLYWVAVKNDPRNAIAVVGLARVALERNDDRAAYELSRQALTIDPENAAALRLEARLSEVLTHRGEAVERPSFVQPGGPGTGAVDRLAAGSRNAGRVGLPDPPDAPFPPMRRAGTDGASESIGTVMGRQRPGWQPAKMPVSAPSSVPAGMPAPSDARPVQINVEAVADAQPIDAQRVEPQPIRIWPRPEISPIPSSGPTRYAATVEAEEPGSSGQAPSMPGGVPQGAVGERPDAAAMPDEAITAPTVADAATEPTSADAATEPTSAEATTEPTAADAATEPTSAEGATEPTAADAATEPTAADAATEPTVSSSPAEAKAARPPARRSLLRRLFGR